MTASPDDKPSIVAVIETILGSSSSHDGHSIRLGIVSGEAVTADLIISTDRAVDLMAAVAVALGQAAKNRTDDPKTRYILPAERWEVEQIQDPQTLTLAFQLPGGGELCFRIDRAEGQHMHEALGVLLGLAETTPIPKSQKH